MDSVAPFVLFGLFLVAVFAGCIDAVAGGGGLLTLPALLIAQVPPVNALATNKLQGSFGSFTAAVSMRKRGLVGDTKMLLPFVGALVGGAIGAGVVQFLNTDSLHIVVPLVLAAIGVYFIFMPRYDDAVERVARLSPRAYCATVIPGIGIYDGVFGPGTGSFFTAAGVSLRSQQLVSATAQAKILNFGTNAAALVVFVLGGKLMWLLGVVMGLGQIMGAYLGSVVVHRGGGRVIRPVVVTVCFAMLANYFWKQWY